MERNPLFLLWERISKKEKICIAIDGSTYSSDDDDITALSFLNCYDQFEVMYISLKENEKEGIKANVYRPEYVREDEIEIKKYNPRMFMGSGFRNKDIKNKLSIELIAAITFGDLAITKENVFSKIDLEKFRYYFYGNAAYVGNLPECLSAIRPYINKKSKLSEEKGKYSYLISNWNSIYSSGDMLLPKSEPVWRAAASIKNEKFLLGEGTLKDFLYAIIIKMQHIMVTRDKLEVMKFCSYESSICSNNNYSNNMIYYFCYLLILAVGIIDSLCWVINWSIDRINPKNYEVTIRKRSSRYKQFESALIRHNKKLADYLSKDGIQSFFELIYFLRNYIAHNIMPDRIDMWGNYQGLQGNLILLKGNIEEKIDAFKKYNSSFNDLNTIGIEIIKRYKDTSKNQKILDPVIFGRFAVKEVLEITDDIFELLSLEIKMITEKEERAKYDEYAKIAPRRKESEILEKTKRILSIIETRLP